MIGFIRGRVAAVEEGEIILENNGIGYRISVSDISGFQNMGDSQEEITVHTEMIVREDGMTLCGFRRKSDLMIFKRLLTVNGVGTKAALAILGIMKSEDLSRAIVFEDIDAITRAPGIGKKTAQRIVLELKDKLGDISGIEPEDIVFAGNTKPVSAGEDARTEALEALIALGYGKSEAAFVISQIKEDFEDSQDYIKTALKRML